MCSIQKIARAQAFSRIGAGPDPFPASPRQPASIFALLGLHALNIAHDPTIEAMAWFLLESQRADGSFAAVILDANGALITDYSGTVTAQRIEVE